MKRAVMVVLGAALILLCGATLSPQDTALDHGKGIYAAQKCAVCHSIAGEGNKKGPLDGVGSRLKDEEIRKWITAPKEMKADVKKKGYPNLPEKDLDDLTSYLLSLE